MTTSEQELRQELANLVHDFIGAVEELDADGVDPNQGLIAAMDLAIASISLILAGTPAHEAIQLVTSGNWDEITRRIVAAKESSQNNA